jgi:hypothetical protein
MNAVCDIAAWLGVLAFAHSKSSYERAIINYALGEGFNISIYFNNLSFKSLNPSLLRTIPYGENFIAETLSGEKK